MDNALAEAAALLLLQRKLQGMSADEVVALLIPQFSQRLKVELLRSHGQILLWGETAQGHIRAVVIVGSHPLRGEVLTLVNTGITFPSGLSC